MALGRTLASSRLSALGSTYYKRIDPYRRVSVLFHQIGSLPPQQVLASSSKVTSGTLQPSLIFLRLLAVRAKRFG